MNWLGQCRYNKTRNWNSTTCMEYSWELFRSIDEVKALWSDYFVFGFVRNPWDRAYSLYKDIVGTNHFIHKHGPRCSLAWGSFCRDPFGEFDRLVDTGCGHVEHHYGYWHMMDQYHCMVTSTGEWAVDFLGRVEHGDEDWKVVVNEMNARRLPGVPEVQYSSYGHVHKVEPGQKPPEPKKKQHTRPPPSLRMSARRSLRYVPFGQAAGGACEDPDGPYCGANEHCIDAVSQWYACDAEKFGYLPKLNATRRQQQRLR
ncbi:hypothetical protein OEZ86_013919 [Tetradesmus obliquus]|nr:hypothetical protein OEZ86_013919 [Tetradesmus obliquus]